MVGATAFPEPAATVRLILFAEVENRPRPMRVEFVYHAADPFAVLFNFRSNRQSWICWSFARDLLADGVNTAAGDGDVHVAPDATDPTVVWVSLCSPSGTGTYAFRRADLEHALDASEGLVPAGCESALIDWEHEFAVLGGGR